MVDRTVSKSPAYAFRDHVNSALRLVAISLLSVYVAWNLYWAFLGRVAPSLFTGLTGLPCPTTGGTRAVLALASGDWQSSLNYNVMAIPIVVMFGLSLAMLMFHRWRLGRFSLPSWVVPAWLVVLGMAWTFKFLSSSEYW